MTLLFRPLLRYLLPAVLLLHLARAHLEASTPRAPSLRRTAHGTTQRQEKRNPTCSASKDETDWKPTYRRKAVHGHAGGKTCHHFHHVQGHSESMKKACSPSPPGHGDHNHQEEDSSKGTKKNDKDDEQDADQDQCDDDSNSDGHPSPHNHTLEERDGGYRLIKNYAGSTFFDEMSFFTQADPSGGMVQYVDRETARKKGLIGTINGNAMMRIGHGDGGLQHAVRISTQDTFTTGIFLLDAYHMPTGCGIWPAFWTTPADPKGGWPNGGEIDVVEGVHYFSRNMYSIHAPSHCWMAEPVQMLGKLAMPDKQLNHNCDPDQTDDQGCGVKSLKNGDYGHQYNINGGGVHALVWDSHHGIRMYFFPRRHIPHDIRAGHPNPSGWGTPAASYPARGCSPDQYFQKHVAVFTNTVCGTWAGAWDVWHHVDGGQDRSCAEKTGKSSCYEYMLSWPNLRTAYWEIASLKIYQKSRRR